MAGTKLTTTTQSGGFLLDANITDTTSAVFSVLHLPLRIVAYNLVAGDVVHVHRLLLPRTNTVRDECGEVVAQAIIAEQPLRVGCER